MKGEAEAFAIEAKAKAEAEQMTKKAEAWKEYKDAAMVNMVLEVVPKVSLQMILYGKIRLASLNLFCYLLCCFRFVLKLLRHLHRE